MLYTNLYPVFIKVSTQFFPIRISILHLNDMQIKCKNNKSFFVPDEMLRRREFYAENPEAGMHPTFQSIRSQIDLNQFFFKLFIARCPL